MIVKAFKRILSPVYIVRMVPFLKSTSLTHGSRLKVHPRTPTVTNYIKVYILTEEGITILKIYFLQEGFSFLVRTACLAAYEMTLQL
jgi:hypothetical protein